jgi:hypothetical protein
MELFRLVGAIAGFGVDEKTGSSYAYTARHCDPGLSSPPLAGHKNACSWS